MALDRKKATPPRKPEPRKVIDPPIAAPPVSSPDSSQLWIDLTGGTSVMNVPNGVVLRCADGLCYVPHAECVDGVLV